MFIFDWVGASLFEGITDWILGLLLELTTTVFSILNTLSLDVLSNEWVKGLLSYLIQPLGYTLFAVGLGVACFECAIAYNKGNGNWFDVFQNGVKGFIASGLFVDLPIALFWLSTKLSNMFSEGVSSEGVGSLAQSVVDSFTNGDIGGNVSGSAIFVIIVLIALMYAIIKISFEVLKRGGILIIQLVVGALYMFSVPRGFTDNFVGWVKQIIGLSLQIFLFSVFQSVGLYMMIHSNMWLGLGLLLSATEIPRVLQQFGLETASRSNIMGTAVGAGNMIRVFSSIGKGGV